MDDVAVFTPARILVADDDPSILRLVTAILRRSHYDVDTAVNGREALEKIERARYDVVMLDLMMPELSGIAALARLQVRDPRPKFVIIMSAASSTVLAAAAGPNVFAALRKPFEIDELLATVRECIAAGDPSADFALDRKLDCA